MELPLHTTPFLAIMNTKMAVSQVLAHPQHALALPCCLACNERVSFSYSLSYLSSELVVKTSIFRGSPFSQRRHPVDTKLLPIFHITFGFCNTFLMLDDLGGGWTHTRPLKGHTPSHFKCLSQVFLMPGINLFSPSFLPQVSFCFFIGTAGASKSCLS